MNKKHQIELDNNRDGIAGLSLSVPLFMMVASQKLRDEDEDVAANAIAPSKVVELQTMLEKQVVERIGAFRDGLKGAERNVRVDIIPALTPAKTLIEGLPRSVGERVLDIASVLKSKSQSARVATEIKSLATHLAFAPARGPEWEVAVYVVPFFLQISPSVYDEMKREAARVMNEGFYTIDSDASEKIGDLLPGADRFGHVATMMSEWRSVATAQRFMLEYATTSIVEEGLADNRSFVLAAGEGRNLLVRDGMVQLPFLTVDEYAAEISALDDVGLSYMSWLATHYSLIRLLQSRGINYQVVQSIELSRALTDEVTQLGKLKKYAEVVAVEQWDLEGEDEEYEPAHSVLCIHGSEDGVCVGSLAIYDELGVRLRRMDLYQVDTPGVDQIKREAKAIALKEGVKMAVMGDGTVRVDVEQTFFYSPTTMPGMLVEGNNLNIKDLH